MLYVIVIHIRMGHINICAGNKSELTETGLVQFMSCFVGNSKTSEKLRPRGRVCLACTHTYYVFVIYCCKETGEREREAFKRIRVSGWRWWRGAGFRWNNSHPNWEHLALTDNRVEKDGASYSIVHVSGSLSFLIQYPKQGRFASLSYSPIPPKPSPSYTSRQPPAPYRPLLLPNPSIHSTHSFQYQTGRERPTTVILYSLKPLPTPATTDQRCLWGWFHKDLNTSVLHKPVTDHTRCLVDFTYGNNSALRLWYIQLQI